jgi:hypothetical protein
MPKAVLVLQSLHQPERSGGLCFGVSAGGFEIENF